MKWEVQKDSFDMEVERRLEDQDVKFGGGGLIHLICKYHYDNNTSYTNFIHLKKGLSLSLISIFKCQLHLHKY